MDSTAGLNRLGRLAGSSAPSSRSLFFFTLGATLILRLLIAVLLVFTGDEAYYYFWGLHPALAYYDHPGMVGWLLAPFALTGNAEWWIRLPAVLLLPAVAWLTVVLARPAGATRAYLAGTAVMLVPPELFNVLSTTDTPLVFFSLASVAAYQRALAAADGGGVNRWHWLAGLLLGAAFCSKYFAVLLGLGYLVHALIAPRRERPWPGLAALVAAAAPWVLLNIYANYEHCWLNILFNLYSRNDNIGFSAATIANYAGVVLYTTSPVLLWLLVRDGDRFRQQFHDPRRRIVVCACIVPLVAFALLSTVKTIGLHWVFAFSPLVFVLGAFMLDERSLRLDVRFLTLFSLAHLLAICILWALPLETWSRTRLYDGLVLTVEPMEMLNALRPY